jgi:hypothetical protein
MAAARACSHDLGRHRVDVARQLRAAFNASGGEGVGSCLSRQALGEKLRSRTVARANPVDARALLHRTLTSHSGIGPSGRSEVELIGAHVQGNRAQVVLFDGHGGDDSISGEEYAATAVLDSGSWRVERLEQRETCWRGVSEGLCL